MCSLKDFACKRSMATASTTVACPLLCIEQSCWKSSRVSELGLNFGLANSKRFTYYFGIIRVACRAKPSIGTVMNFSKARFVLAE